MVKLASNCSFDNCHISDQIVIPKDQMFPRRGLLSALDVQLSSSAAAATAAAAAATTSGMILVKVLISLQHLLCTAYLTLRL